MTAVVMEQGTTEAVEAVTAPPSSPVAVGRGSRESASAESDVAASAGEIPAGGMAVGVREVADLLQPHGLPSLSAGYEVPDCLPAAPARPSSPSTF